MQPALFHICTLYSVQFLQITGCAELPVGCLETEVVGPSFSGQVRAFDKISGLISLFTCALLGTSS